MVGTCEYGNELSGSIKCGEFLELAAEPVSFSRRILRHGVSKGLRLKLYFDIRDSDVRGAVFDQNYLVSYSHQSSDIPFSLFPHIFRHAQVLVSAPASRNKERPKKGCPDTSLTT